MSELFASAFLLLIVLANQVSTTGVFEVKIQSLLNNRGQTSTGRCCSGSRDSSGTCSEQCRTFFYVCLLHFQTPIPKYHSCTFGSALTPVLGGNTFGFGREFQDAPLVVSVPFMFLWPESFGVVVEVWHDSDGNRSKTDPTNLIARVSRVGKLLPSLTWQNHSRISQTVELRYSYRVICDQFYYGAGCDILCRERDDRFGHYLCGGNGTRLCLSGWEGEFCDKAKCTDMCTKSHGFCDRPYECRCRLGWRGMNCQECIPFPSCLHGYCRDAWQCICHEGWSGSFCSVDNKYCDHYKPCQHGGICHYDSVSNYTCTCPSGFTGPSCESETCFRGFCLNNGECSDSGGQRHCRCRRGFGGRRCEHVETMCGDLDCRNNASCRRVDAEWMCLCPPGFTGLECESEIDECESSPCFNGGTCRDRINGYHCECHNGYLGRNCDIALDPCLGFECFNGGLCKISSGGYTPVCHCQKDFIGYRCETPLNPCLGITCFHGGVCKKLEKNSFLCECAPGFTGNICQIKRKQIASTCADLPCQNGGDCKQYADGFRCICAPGYDGKTCERQSMSSDEPWNSIQSVPHNVKALEKSSSSVPVYRTTLLLCLGVLAILFSSR
ncbi:delta-like protein D [Gigantopelta aegis]|uniref:delta-like protein D n=1 Tax=Gigantopelta aegis TaxID=1735272 RepID=UPI001B88D4E2|nr:delta-like protein D [Gigantopelta aegis]